MMAIKISLQILTAAVAPRADRAALIISSVNKKKGSEIPQDKHCRLLKLEDREDYVQYIFFLDFLLKPRRQIIYLYIFYLSKSNYTYYVNYKSIESINQRTSNIVAF